MLRVRVRIHILLFDYKGVNSSTSVNCEKSIEYL